MLTFIPPALGPVFPFTLKTFCEFSLFFLNVAVYLKIFKHVAIIFQTQQQRDVNSKATSEFVSCEQFGIIKPSSSVRYNAIE